MDQLNNTLIVGGQFDMLITSNGTLVTIQNMVRSTHVASILPHSNTKFLRIQTWGGKQGFQTQPATPFYVPYHPGLAQIVHDIEYQPIPGPIGTSSSFNLLSMVPGPLHTAYTDLSYSHRRRRLGLPRNLPHRTRPHVVRRQPRRPRSPAVRPRRRVSPARVPARPDRESGRGGRFHDAAWELHGAFE